MLHAILKTIDSLTPIPTASAHCDIPCKIYDPGTAQLAALTIIRMVDLIEELGTKDSLSIEEQAQLIRLVSVKEVHGLAVKDEVRVIWGDYFKQPQFDKVPGVHDLVHKIMLQASKAKQGVNRGDALTLLVLVNQFAEAFWLTKDVPTFKAVCPYPPAEVVVYPKLDEVK